MPICTTPLTLVRGGKRTWRFRISASDGSAIDLSSASIAFTVRRDFPHGSVPDDSDSGVVFTRREGGSGITANASGHVYVTVVKANTVSASAFEDGNSYRYGLEYALPSDSEPVTAAQAPFYLRPDVVRGL